MKLIWPILAIFAGRFFGSVIFTPGIDGDLPWQLWLGQQVHDTARIPRAIGAETYTAPGASWVPQEWLFSLVASVSHGVGWFIFLGFSALAAGGALGIGVLRAARTGAFPLATTLTLALAGMALLESFGVRAQVIVWPLLAGFFFCLELESWRAAYWAIAIVALWSNLHASALLAVPFALVSALGSYLDERLSRRVVRSLLVACGSAIATCCTPLGIDVPRYALMLMASPFKKMIEEWQPTTFTDFSFTYGALPLLLCLVCFGVHGTHKWRDRLVVLTATLLMLSAVRNNAIFGLICFPVAARVLSASSAFFAPRSATPTARGNRLDAILIPALSVVLAVVSATSSADGARASVRDDAELQSAIAAVRTLPGTRRAFCEDFAWCNALVAQPGERVFLDGRADPYPQRVWDDYGAIKRVKANWHQLLRSSGTDVVLVKPGSALDGVLTLLPNWRRTFKSKKFAIFALTTIKPATRSLASMR